MLKSHLEFFKMRYNVIDRIERLFVDHNNDVLQTVNDNIAKVIEEEREAVAREKREERRYRSSIDWLDL